MNRHGRLDNCEQQRVVENRQESTMRLGWSLASQRGVRTTSTAHRTDNSSASLNRIGAVSASTASFNSRPEPWSHGYPRR